MNNGMNAWHIAEPTVAKIRSCVQSLVGRSHRPFPGGSTFEEVPRPSHMFRGYIDYESFNKMRDSDLEGVVMIDSGVFQIAHTGVIFLVTEFVKGAFIFTERDPTVLRRLA